MSKIENNKPRSLPEDAFEKDAAEGFGRISAEELQALKAETDQAVSNLLQSQPAKKRSYYWMAAALLLLAGLVIFLFLKPAPEQVALQQSRPQNTTPKTFTGKQTDAAKLLSTSTPSIETKAVSTVNKTAALQAKKTPDPVSEKSEEKTNLVLADQKQISASEMEGIDLAIAEPSEMNAAPPATEIDMALRMEMSTAEKTKKSKEKLTTSLTPAASHAAANQENKALFKGGEEALKAELKKILSADSLIKPLRLTFLLNPSAAIEKVEIVKPSSMSEARKKEVIKQLSRLQGFQFETTDGLSFPQFYIVDFIP